MADQTTKTNGTSTTKNTEINKSIKELETGKGVKMSYETFKELCKTLKKD